MSLACVTFDAERKNGASAVAESLKDSFHAALK
jgi:hypothetical protein